VIADADDTYVPSHARVSLETLAAQLRAAEEQIPENDRRIIVRVRETERGRD
jgi:hypothetical protein